MTWKRNYASLDQSEVLHDQASREQVLVMSESEAGRRYPDLVVASLGATRKDKPYGDVSARVLFDGTHRLSVNRRTRIREQERAPKESHQGKVQAGRAYICTKGCLRDAPTGSHTSTRLALSGLPGQ